MALTLRADTNISGCEVSALASYKETIKTQCGKLNKEINWWPCYFYHYTDVNHAVSIIEMEWIYDRVSAKKRHLIKTDAASQNVLKVTGDKTKHCGRLYMRPLTPTQFYSEGYKPKKARYEGYKDATCPVPVFFLFDAVKTLKYPGVFFAEGGAAAFKADHLKAGPDEFAKLSFDKIFHHGGLGYTAEIGQYRRTEVLREGGIPLHGLLKRIVCRSAAEAQTLQFLIRKRCPECAKEYIPMIMVAPPSQGLYMFTRNGLYIRSVCAEENRVRVDLNEAGLRYVSPTEEGKRNIFVEMTATITWKNWAGKTVDVSEFHGKVDYERDNRFYLIHNEPISDSYFLEIRFDDNRVFCDNLYLDMEELL